jgi:hypothetical protein
MIAKRIAISLTTLTLVGAWALPASAAGESGWSTPKVVRTAAPSPWQQRPIRIASADWPLPRSYHAGVSYLILGVGF